HSRFDRVLMGSPRSTPTTSTSRCPGTHSPVQYGRPYNLLLPEANPDRIRALKARRPALPFTLDQHLNERLAWYPFGLNKHSTFDRQDLCWGVFTFLAIHQQSVCATQALVAKKGENLLGVFIRQQLELHQPFTVPAPDGTDQLYQARLA